MPHSVILNRPTNFKLKDVFDLDFFPMSVVLKPFTDISAKRDELPWLGAATTSTSPAPSGRGWMQHFENGSIYYTSEHGAHEVHGAIRGKYHSLGSDGSFLGFPLTDETPTADGIGRFNHFQGGSIYWSPSTGAWEVHGAIRDKWNSIGAERSFLGYPVSDEHSLMTPFVENGRISNFQQGQISWSPAWGAGVSSTTFNPQSNGGIRPQGLGPRNIPDIRRRVVIAATMDLTDHETFGSNEHSHAALHGEAIITNSMPQELITMIDGAGGEMRVELRLNAQATLTGDVMISGQALLYEGTSEQTEDLDGDELISFLAPRDNFVSKTYTVRNEDEGDDFGVITMTISNFPV